MMPEANVETQPLKSRSSEAAAHAKDDGAMNPVLDKFPQIQPFDEHNQALIANVHPMDWTNPEPTGRYNMVVIGGGTAGLVTAAGAAGLGAKVLVSCRKPPMATR